MQFCVHTFLLWLCNIKQLIFPLFSLCYWRINIIKIFLSALSTQTSSFSTIECLANILSPLFLNLKIAKWVAEGSCETWFSPDPSSNLKTFVICLMLSQKRIQSCINSMTKSHVCACMYACMHTCTEKSGRKEANTLKSYLWMGGLMTTIFLSFSGAGEVDLKSLKYIHITLNFSFFHTAEVTYECIFIVKIQTHYLYR